MSKKKNKFLALIFITIFLIMAFGTIHYLRLKEKTAPPPESEYTELNFPSSVFQDWKIYKNKIYNFEFYYPQNQNLELKESEGLLSAPVEKSIKLETPDYDYEKNIGQSLSLYINSTDDLLNSGWFNKSEITKEGNSTINDINWIFVYTKGEPNAEVQTKKSISALTVKNGLTYNLMVNYVDVSSRSIDLFNQVLTSFNFK